MLISALFAWLLNLMNLSHTQVHELQSGSFKNVRLYEPAKKAERLLILVTSDQQKDLFNLIISESFSRGSTAVAVVSLDENILQQKPAKNCRALGDELSKLSIKLIAELNLGALPPPLLVSTSQVNTWVREIIEQSAFNYFIGYLHGESDVVNSSFSKKISCESSRPRPIVQLKIEELKNYSLIENQNAAFEILISTQLNEAAMVTEESRKEIARNLKAAAHLVYELSSHPDDIYGPSRARIDRLILTEAQAIEMKQSEMVILFSGDGGWEGFMQDLTQNIVKSGRSVVGIDLIPYIWNRRSPEGVAYDIESIFRIYSKKWNIKKFSVYGFSHGADIVPFAINRLSPKVRSQLRSVGLISPSQSTEFKFSLGSWFYDYEGEFKTAKEVRDLLEQKTNVFCLYGEHETASTSLCLDKSLGSMRSKGLAGGHRMNGDAAEIIKVLSESIEK